MTERIETAEEELRRIGGDVLMTFSQPIASLKTIGGKLFATLEDGTVIDCTELTGKAKH